MNDTQKEPFGIEITVLLDPLSPILPAPHSQSSVNAKVSCESNNKILPSRSQMCLSGTISIVSGTVDHMGAWEWKQAYNTGFYFSQYTCMYPWAMSNGP